LANIDIRGAEFSRILLIKPSAVGDVVHALPVLEKLRRRYPGARIDWLLTPENAEIVRGHAGVSNIVLFARKEFAQEGRRLSASAAMLGMVRELQGARYEMVIDLHGQLRSGLFAMVSGAPVRVGFDKPIRRGESVFQGKRLGNIPRRGWAGAREGSWLAYTHRIPIPTLEIHAVDRYLWVGKLLGLDDGAPVFNLPAAPEAEGRVRRMLEGRVKTGQRLAVLAPGTMWETKHWRAEGFAEVARGLMERGFAVILTGGKGEQALSGRIRAEAPGTMDVTGQTSLADVVALLRRAAVVVTNDSGVMHIAAALGRPAVSVFGPTNPVQVGPYGQPENVVRLDLECSPCNYRRLSQCPNSHACMRDLGAEMVLERVRVLFPTAEGANR